MAYITVNEARAAAQTVWATKSIAEGELRKAAGAPMTTTYDIFLSHAFEDAQVIAGLRVLIQQEGLSVYVDWIEDPQADRSRVTTATADLLRRRMNHCRHLLYASTTASSNSKWMPWELGYFDGLRQGHVGILPVVQSSGQGFVGQEYLGLYPKYEFLSFKKHGRRLGRDIDPNTGDLLFEEARRQ